MSRTDKEKKTKKNANRSERLAGALRENLRRRKAQERAREDAETAGPAEKPEPAHRDNPVR
jgi:hypothetical protein